MLVSLLRFDKGRESTWLRLVFVLHRIALAESVFLPFPSLHFKVSSFSFPSSVTREAILCLASLILRPASITHPQRLPFLSSRCISKSKMLRIFSPFRNVARVKVEEDAEFDIDIIQATITNSKSMVKAALLQDPEKIKRTNNNGSSPLTISSFNSNSNMVKLLLEYGADPNHINNAGVSCLMFATKCGKFDNYINRFFYPSYDSYKCCEILLDYGALLNKRTLLGTTALMMAQAANNVKAMKLLIKRGADVTPLRVNGQSVFDLGMPKMKDSLRRVISRTWFDTILHQAVYMDEINSVRNLISVHECPRQFVNIPGKEGWTPLHVAAYLNRLECTRVLLMLGANPNAKNNNALTPLHIAASRGYTDILNELMLWMHIIATSGPNFMDRAGDEMKDGHYNPNIEEDVYLDANSEMVLYSTSP